MKDITAKQLPTGWEWKSMEDIADVIGGGTPKSTDSSNYEGGDIPWLTPADLSGYTNKYVSNGERYITKKGLAESSARMMPKGTVLFTSRAPIGYVVIASNPICTNQGFKSFVIKENKVIPEYVYWWLKGSKQLAESMASGTTFLELNGSKAKQLPIPVAPLEQQKQIVAKIEELFSHIDAGIDALKQSKQLLKQYRQSVLKAAVTGELSKEWREQNKDKLELASKLLERILQERRQKWEAQQMEQFKAKGKVPKDEGWKGKYKEPSAPDTSDLPELPEGWCWANLSQISLQITDGEHFKPDVQKSGVFFLSAKDVRDDGVTFDDPLYISNETAEKALLRCNPELGDILIVSRGATVGRMCIVNTHEKFCLLGSVILIKVSNGINSRHLLNVMKSPDINRQISNVSGATAQQAIYLRDIQNVAMPLCPIEEQEVISHEVDSKISSITELEKSIDSELQRSERLKQSVLQSAFGGNI